MRLLFVLLAFTTPVFAQSPASTAPPSLTFNGGELAAAKAHPTPALLAKITHDADEALQRNIPLITDKPKTPPSGDKHDYMSLARYWWPNPDTPNHEPYVRHDGRTNPEIHEVEDLDHLEVSAKCAEALALGWYFTGNKEYAAKAEEILRNWFLRPETSMHPNLDFAQYIPGVNTGRGAGILDGRRLTRDTEAAALLHGAPGWTAADEAGMQTWFGKYYNWLLTSRPGHDEHNAPNNHGSWFAAQSATIAAFLGKTADVRSIATAVREQRIPSQFDAQGLQKYELVRTNSFSYSAFNLEALTTLAIVAAPAGVDLYTPAKPGQKGILEGIDALIPFDAAHPWTHQQIDPNLRTAVCVPLGRALGRTHDPKYADARKRFDCKAEVEDLVREAAASSR